MEGRIISTVNPKLTTKLPLCSKCGQHVSEAIPRYNLESDEPVTVEFKCHGESVSLTFPRERFDFTDSTISTGGESFQAETISDLPEEWARAVLRDGALFLE